jgi:hypothetical protein
VDKYCPTRQFFEMPFDREQMRLKVKALADEGVFIGTSSWKYEGWLNQL